MSRLPLFRKKERRPIIMGNNKKTNYKNPNRRARGFNQIVYAESAPQNYVEQLKHEVDMGKLKFIIISPFHNLDWYSQQDEAEYNLKKAQGLLDAVQLQNPIIAGTYKKPHWHISAEFKNPIQKIYAERHMQGITNGSFVVQREDLRGTVRYMAHLDENPTEKAMYDPDQIFAYGDIKIDKFLNDEDKSMNSLTAWKEIKQIIVDNNITNYRDFDDLMDSQDIDLQLQFQKNIRLANRAKDYIYSMREQNNMADTLTKIEMGQRQVAKERRDLQKLIEGGGVTLDFAQAQLNKLS